MPDELSEQELKDAGISFQFIDEGSPEPDPVSSHSEQELKDGGVRFSYIDPEPEPEPIWKTLLGVSAKSAATAAAPLVGGTVAAYKASSATGQEQVGPTQEFQQWSDGQIKELEGQLETKVVDEKGNWAFNQIEQGLSNLWDRFKQPGKDIEASSTKAWDEWAKETWLGKEWIEDVHHTRQITRPFVMDQIAKMAPVDPVVGEEFKEPGRGWLYARAFSETLAEMFPVSPSEAIDMATAMAALTPANRMAISMLSDAGIAGTGTKAIQRGLRTQFQPSKMFDKKYVRGQFETADEWIKNWESEAIRAFRTKWNRAPSHRELETMRNWFNQKALGFPVRTPRQDAFFKGRSGDHGRVVEPELVEGRTPFTKEMQVMPTQGPPPPPPKAPPFPPPYQPRIKVDPKTGIGYEEGPPGVILRGWDGRDIPVDKTLRLPTGSNAGRLPYDPTIQMGYEPPAMAEEQVPKFLEFVKKVQVDDLTSDGVAFSNTGKVAKIVKYPGKEGYAIDFYEDAQTYTPYRPSKPLSKEQAIEQAASYLATADLEMYRAEPIRSISPRRLPDMPELSGVDDVTETDLTYILPGLGKPAYQATLEEVTGAMMGQMPSGQLDLLNPNDIRMAHRIQVAAAARRGWPVPTHVARQYPEIYDQKFENSQPDAIREQAARETPQIAESAAMTNEQYVDATAGQQSPETADLRHLAARAVHQASGAQAEAVKRPEVESLDEFRHRVGTAKTLLRGIQDYPDQPVILGEAQSIDIFARWAEKYMRETPSIQEMMVENASQDAVRQIAKLAEVKSSLTTDRKVQNIKTQRALEAHVMRAVYGEVDKKKIEESVPETEKKDIEKAIAGIDKEIDHQRGVLKSILQFDAIAAKPTIERAVETADKIVAGRDAVTQAKQYVREMYSGKEKNRDYYTATIDGREITLARSDDPRTTDAYGRLAPKRRSWKLATPGIVRGIDEYTIRTYGGKRPSAQELALDIKGYLEDEVGKQEWWAKEMAESHHAMKKKHGLEEFENAEPGKSDKELRIAWLEKQMSIFSNARVSVEQESKENWHRDSVRALAANQGVEWSKLGPESSSLKTRGDILKFLERKYNEYRAEFNELYYEQLPEEEKLPDWVTEVDETPENNNPNFAAKEEPAEVAKYEFPVEPGIRSQGPMIFVEGTFGGQPVKKMFSTDIVAMKTRKTRLRELSRALRWDKNLEPSQSAKPLAALDKALQSHLKKMAPEDIFTLPWGATRQRVLQIADMDPLNQMLELPSRFWKPEIESTFLSYAENYYDEWVNYRRGSRVWVDGKPVAVEPSEAPPEYSSYQQSQEAEHKGKSRGTGGIFGKNYRKALEKVISREDEGGNSTALVKGHVFNYIERMQENDLAALERFTDEGDIEMIDRIQTAIRERNHVLDVKEKNHPPIPFGKWDTRAVEDSGPEEPREIPKRTRLMRHNRAIDRAREAGIEITSGGKLVLYYPTSDSGGFNAKGLLKMNERLYINEEQANQVAQELGGDPRAVRVEVPSTSVKEFGDHWRIKDNLTYERGIWEFDGTQLDDTRFTDGVQSIDEALKPTKDLIFFAKLSSEDLKLIAERKQVAHNLVGGITRNPKFAAESAEIIPIGDEEMVTEGGARIMLRQVASPTVRDIPERLLYFSPNEEASQVFQLYPNLQRSILEHWSASRGAADFAEYMIREDAEAYGLFKDKLEAWWVSRGGDRGTMGLLQFLNWLAKSSTAELPRTNDGIAKWQEMQAETGPGAFRTNRADHIAAREVPPDEIRAFATRYMVDEDVEGKFRGKQIAAIKEFAEALPKLPMSYVEPLIGTVLKSHEFGTFNKLMDSMKAKPGNRKRLFDKLMAAFVDQPTNYFQVNFLDPVVLNRFRTILVEEKNFGKNADLLVNMGYTGKIVKFRRRDRVAEAKLIMEDEGMAYGDNPRETRRMLADEFGRALSVQSIPIDPRTGKPVKFLDEKITGPLPKAYLNGDVVEFEKIPVRTPQQKVALFLPLRNGSFESLAGVYVDENMVPMEIDHLTNKLPARVMGRSVGHIEKRMEELKAAYYFEIHNHPARGKGKPSTADMARQAHLVRSLGKRALPAMVTNHEEFSVYDTDESGQWASHTTAPYGGKQAKNFHSRHPKLGKGWKKLWERASGFWGKKENVVAYINQAGRILKVESYPGNVNLGERMAERMVELGAMETAVMYDKGMKPDIASLPSETSYIIEYDPEKHLLDPIELKGPEADKRKSAWYKRLKEENAFDPVVWVSEETMGPRDVPKKTSLQRGFVRLFDGALITPGKLRAALKRKGIKMQIRQGKVMISRPGNQEVWFGSMVNPLKPTPERVKWKKDIEEDIKAIGISPEEVAAKMGDALTSIRFRSEMRGKHANAIEFATKMLHEVTAQIRQKVVEVSMKRKWEREAIVQQARLDRQNILAAQKKLHKYLRENVNMDFVPERSQRALFNRILEAKTGSKIVRALKDIEYAATASYRKELIENIKGKIKQLSHDKKVSGEFATAALELVEPFRAKDFGVKIVGKGKKARKVSIYEKLLKTYEWIQKEIEAGRDPYLPRHIIKKLKMLFQSPLKWQETEILEAIYGEMLALEKAGMQATDMRLAIFKDRVETDLRQAEQDTIPFERHTRHGEETAGMTWDERLNYAIRFGLDAARTLDLAITPMDIFFDELDGGRGFRGTNHRIFKQPVDRNYQVYLSEKIKVTDELQKAADEAGYTREMGIRISLYGFRVQVGGREYLYNSGYTDKEIDAVQLTAKERKLYMKFREVLERYFPEVQATLLELDGRSIQGLKSYLPVMFRDGAFQKDDGIESLVQSIFEGAISTRNITQKVQQGFVMPREGSTKKIRMDLLDVMTKHMNRVLYYINMQPTIRRLHAVAKDKRYRAVAGDKGQEMVLAWIDTLARDGGIPDEESVIIGWLRRNTSAAVLGLKAGSALIQVTAIGDAAAIIGPGYVSKAGTAYVTDERVKRFVFENMPELRARVGDDPAYLHLSNIPLMRKAQTVGLYPLQWVDKHMAGISAYAGYLRACHEAGVPVDLDRPVKDLIERAQLYMRLSQASQYPKDLPPAFMRAFRGRGRQQLPREIVTLMLQFQTFMVNRHAALRYLGLERALLGRRFERPSVEASSGGGGRKPPPLSGGQRIGGKFPEGGKSGHIRGKEPTYKKRSEFRSKTDPDLIYAIQMLGILLGVTVAAETAIRRGVRESQSRFVGLMTPGGRELVRKEDRGFAEHYMVELFNGIPFIGQLINASVYKGSTIPALDAALKTIYGVGGVMGAVSPQARRTGLVRMTEGAATALGVPGTVTVGSFLRNLLEQKHLTFPREMARERKKLNDRYKKDAKSITPQQMRRRAKLNAAYDIHSYKNKQVRGAFEKLKGQALERKLKLIIKEWKSTMDRKQSEIRKMK